MRLAFDDGTLLRVHGTPAPSGREVGTLGGGCEDVDAFTGDDMAGFEFLDFRVTVVSLWVIFPVGVDGGGPVVDSGKFDDPIQLFAGKSEPEGDTACATEEVDCANDIVATTAFTKLEARMPLPPRASTTSK